MMASPVRPDALQALLDRLSKRLKTMESDKHRKTDMYVLGAHVEGWGSCMHLLLLITVLNSQLPVRSSKCMAR